MEINKATSLLGQSGDSVCLKLAAQAIVAGKAEKKVLPKGSLGVYYSLYKEAFAAEAADNGRKGGVLCL